MRAARGSIRKRGRSTWELSVRIHGQRLTKTVPAETRQDAEDALLDWRRELRDEGVPDRDPTVAELVDEWLGVVRGRVKERTAVRYEQLLRVHVLPVIANERVRALRAGDVQRVIDKVLATRSGQTALHVYRVTSEIRRGRTLGDRAERRQGSPPAASSPARAPRANRRRMAGDPRNRQGNDRGGPSDPCCWVRPAGGGDPRTSAPRPRSRPQPALRLRHDVPGRAYRAQDRTCAPDRGDPAIRDPLPA